MAGSRPRIADPLAPTGSPTALTGSRDGLAPLHSDWWHRPTPWRRVWALTPMSNVPSGRRITDDVAVFHDCPQNAVTVETLPEAGVHVTAPGFAGAFLSLAVDIPAEGRRGLSRHHILSARLTTEGEAEPNLSMRLNIECGPNTVQKTLSNPTGGGVVFDFDLHDSDIAIEEHPVRSMWVDLILATPVPARLTVHDLTLSRRPRAAF